MKILVLNGPNLNRLGTRKPIEAYGTVTLEMMEEGLKKAFPKVTFLFAQDNSEGALIDCLHEVDKNGFDGVVFNPGGYTHTSISLRDAIDAIDVPVIEVHLSNIYSRQKFRHHSWLAPVCVGQISGLGIHGYLLATTYLVHHMGDQ